MRHVPHCRLDVRGLEAHLPVGETERRQAGGDVGLVSHAIALLLSGRTVISQAVGLDDEAQIRPVEVDLEAVQPDPGLRQPQARPPGDPQEEALEL